MKIVNQQKTPNIKMTFNGQVKEMGFQKRFKSRH